MHNPAELNRLIEDMVFDLDRWDGAAREAGQGAVTAQHHVGEQVDSARRHYGACRDETDLAQEQAQALDRRMDEAEDRATRALAHASDALQEAQEVNGRSRACLEQWQGNEAEARRRMAEAHHNLDAALSDLRRAEGALNSAEASYSSALAALNRCEASGYRDQNGNWVQPNCSGHAASVRRWSAEVGQCQAWVGRAEDDCRRCRADLQRAEARVALCVDNVAVAGQAVSMSAEAVSEAHAARDRAERAGAAWRQADAERLVARRRLVDQAAAVDAMGDAFVRGRTACEEAVVQADLASATQLDTERSVNAARRHLSDLSELLLDFDRPLRR